MATVYDESGNPIDSLAVSIDDMILTVVARLDLLDDDSLSWIARRFVGHAEECARDTLQGARTIAHDHAARRLTVLEGRG